MNDIRVPDNYKHMMRRERNTPEYNDAIIRDFINAHPDKVLTTQDFIGAMDGLTTAMHHVRRLRQRGRIIRTSVKNGQRGHAYTYRWVNGNTVPPMHKPTHGDATTIKPRTAFATDYELKRLDAWFLAYATAHPDDTMVGASAFRSFVYGEQTKIDEQKQLTERSDDSPAE